MPATSTTTSTDPVILIVEDDVAVRQLLQRMFTHLGGRTTTAGDASGAVDAALGQPDLALALIDLSLNGSDGISAARRLQALLPDLAIVLMSGDLDQLAAAQQLVGAPQALSKPFSLKDLSELVALARCNPPRLKERHV